VLKRALSFSLFSSFFSLSFFSVPVLLFHILFPPLFYPVSPFPVSPLFLSVLNIVSCFPFFFKFYSPLFLPCFPFLFPPHFVLPVRTHGVEGVGVLFRRVFAAKDLCV